MFCLVLLFEVDLFLILVHQWMQPTGPACSEARKGETGNEQWGSLIFKLPLLQKLKLSIIRFPISPSAAGCLRHQWHGLVPKGSCNLKDRILSSIILLKIGVRKVGGKLSTVSFELAEKLRFFEAHQVELQIWGDCSVCLLQLPEVQCLY